MGWFGTALALARRRRRVSIRRYRKGRLGRFRLIGFTMIEMLIVIAILGTLLAIALPMLQAALDRARVARTIGDIGALQIDIAAYEAGGKGLPESLATIGRASLLDPWGRPYIYLKFDIDKPGGGAPRGARKDRFLVPLNSTYDLYSVGKDGETVAALTAKASKDDIIRANDGGFIGLAVKY
ncbi:MAG: prepilin-type N-terminal cleavage/methylation domain-containing protein [Gemmatimonadetes bacterium]|nr:prepilin-type N-terminal cleavage/methylation domain-containing protein [Gemmatimonadota bacterium]